MSQADIATLCRSRIALSRHRIAVAGYVLHTDDHPTAEDVWARVLQTSPGISRATVYNTLNLFVSRGLLRRCLMAGERTVFDSNLSDHHHFIDEETGKIYDVPWEAIDIVGVSELTGFEIRDYHLVIRGRKKSVPPRLDRVLNEQRRP